MPEPQYDTDLPFAGLTRFDEGSVPDVWGHGSSMKWWTAAREGWDAPDEDDEDDGIHEDVDVGPGDLPETGFHTRINELPRSALTTVEWVHPLTGDSIETGKHNAVINPERAENVDTFRGTPITTTDELESIIERHREGEIDQEAMEAEFGDAYDADVESVDRGQVTVGDDAVYYVPTDTYTVYNPNDFLTPLADVIQDEGLEEAVFGEFRPSRDGGRVSADVFFDTKHVDHPEMDPDRRPIVAGFQLDWDYFGDTAIRAQGMALDYGCINAMRGITDEVTIKHTGDPEEREFKVGDETAHSFREVWEKLLEKVDLKVDRLSQIIMEAEQDTLDLSEFPDDFAEEYDSMYEAFYAYLDFPTTAQGNELAKRAGDRLRARATDPFEPSWWDVHSAATWAITNYAKGEIGKQGGSIERYQRTARDLLMNPAQVAEQVELAYHEERAEREETTVAEEGGGEAVIASSLESVKDKREQYEERQDAMLALTGEDSGAAEPAEDTSEGEEVVVDADDFDWENA